MAHDRLRRLKRAEELLSMADGRKASDEELDRMAGDILRMVATEPVEKLQAWADELSKGSYEDRAMSAFIRSQAELRELADAMA